MMKKVLYLFVFFISCLVSAEAHTLWIETANTGVKGKPQEVKIYYGEYAEQSPEKPGEWYSDVKEFTLWLIGPDQQAVKLPCTQADNHFMATFTPETEGVYTLAVSHSAKDLGGTTKYQFNAGAVVTVGKAVVPASPAFNNNELRIFAEPGKTAKVNKPLSLKGIFKDQPSGKLHVVVFSPSGWSRKISTDENGVAAFVPLWPGRYMIEASKSEKEEGAHHGKDYKAVWRCATISFDVAK